jgi:hypothetical protein
MEQLLPELTGSDRVIYIIPIYIIQFQIFTDVLFVPAEFFVITFDILWEHNKMKQNNKV